MTLSEAEQLTIRRLEAVASAGYAPRPDRAHVADIRDVLALVQRLTNEAAPAGEDMAAFGASEAACYQYPGEGQSAERLAFCEGAAHAAARFTPYRSLGECDTAAIRAVQFLEEAEDHHANCDDCGGEGVPEQCGTCFPLFDKARVERRLVMQSLAALAPQTTAPPAGEECTDPKCGMRGPHNFCWPKAALAPQTTPDVGALVGQVTGNHARLNAQAVGLDQDGIALYRIRQTDLHAILAALNPVTNEGEG